MGPAAWEALDLWRKRLTDVSPAGSVLQIAVKALGDFLEADRLSIVAPVRPGTLRVLASSDAEAVGDLLISQERYPELLHALTTGQPLLIPDVGRSILLRPVLPHLRATSIVSIAAVPFTLDQRPVILRVLSRTRPLRDLDLAVVTAAAHLLQHVAAARRRSGEEDSWFRLTMEMADLAIDLSPEGRILHCTGDPLPLFGRTREDITDTNILNLLQVGDRAAVQQRILSLLDHPGAGATSQFEAMTHAHPPAVIRASAVVVDGLVPYLRLALRRREHAGADLTQLVDSIPLPLLVYDRSGGLEEANRPAIRLLGRPLDELRESAMTSSLAESGDVASVPSAEGGAIPVAVLRMPEGAVAGGRKIIGLVDLRPFALSRDREAAMRATLSRQISELEKAQERVEEIESLKVRFLASSSHELKTPLTIIQSYLEILSTDLAAGLSDEQLSFIRIAHDAVLRLRRLVLDLVDLAALEGGQMPLSIEQTDLEALVTSVVQEIVPLAEKTGISLVCRVPGSPHPVRADPGRVRQVLHNLLDNALKYTPREGRISVELGYDEDAATVGVTNSDAVIPEEDIPYIFDPFSRGRTDSTSRQPGSGLGLTISRRLMAALGGRLTVESDPAHGTRFEARFPRWPEETPPAGGAS